MRISLAFLACCICVGVLICGCTVPSVSPPPSPTTTPVPALPVTTTPVPPSPPITISPTPSLRPPTPIPTSPLLRDTSVNWAGYVVQTNFTRPLPGVVEAVEGSWTVSAVDCQEVPDSASAFWIGIGGADSRTLQQAGTESDCVRGSPRYAAWYEILPFASVPLDLDVTAGDLVRARVEFAGDDRFRFTLVNMATGQRVSVTGNAMSASRDSAEWIAEAPTSRRRILPLSPFGQVLFSNATVTINGETGTIGDTRWEYQALTMETTGGTTKARPGTLTANGSAFTVRWEHS